jgi:hypothetical protein
MSKKWLFLVGMLLLGIGIAGTLSAQTTDVTVNLNSGTGNTAWTIAGEPSLVINGADVTPLGVRAPFQVKAITISVAVAVPAGAVTAVVYQDTNGGSPADATLVGQKQVTINSAGTFTATFDTPLTVTAPVVWFGFYLPVGFQFFGDTSGASVLTYWAWRPGTTFPLNQLSQANVLGPANGTAPVGINMGGIARMTAIVSGTGITTTPTPIGTIIGAAPAPAGVRTQLVSASIGDRSYLLQYPRCIPLAYDTGDLFNTLRGEILINCSIAGNFDVAAAPTGYIRRSVPFDLTPMRVADRTVVLDGFRTPVTHCMTTQPDDLTRAVMGYAMGRAPRTWQILTTIRVGDIICAEVPGGGYLTYFIPA